MDEPPPPREPRRRRTDRWQHHVKVALLLIATHAYAGYMGHAWPWHS